MDRGANQKARAGGEVFKDDLAVIAGVNILFHTLEIHYLPLFCKPVNRFGSRRFMVLFVYMFTPSVRVQMDITRDVQEFIKFLYRQSPDKQKLIVRAYPDLTSAIKLGEGAGKASVDGFIREQYRVRHEQIGTLVADMEKHVQTEGTKVLEALGSVMEYVWPENHTGYTIIPTLLPFSPFQEPTFFFSLERFLRTNAHSVASGYGITAVLAHEVSHFVFFDLLNQMPEETQTACDPVIKYFAKEILAPIVMNDPRLSNILHLVDYSGNPLLKHISLQRGTDKESIVAFFDAEYKHGQATGFPFLSFVRHLIQTLSSVHSELQQRLTLWSTYGSALLKDSTLKARYCEPIIKK